MRIDGVQKVTITTNLPTQKLQPVYRAIIRATASAEGRIRYYEAFNT